MAVEWHYGADARCVSHHILRRICWDGSWGQVLQETNRKSSKTKFVDYFVVLSPGGQMSFESCSARSFKKSRAHRPPPTFVHVSCLGGEGPLRPQTNRRCPAPDLENDITRALWVSIRLVSTSWSSPPRTRNSSMLGSKRPRPAPKATGKGGRFRPTLAGRGLWDSQNRRDPGPRGYVVFVISQKYPEYKDVPCRLVSGYTGSSCGSFRFAPFLLPSLHLCV